MRLTLSRTCILRHFLSGCDNWCVLSTYNLLPWIALFYLKKFCPCDESHLWTWDQAVPFGPHWTEPQTYRNKSTKQWEQRLFHRSNTETIKIRGSLNISHGNTHRNKLTSFHFYIWRNGGPERFDVWERSKTRNQKLDLGPKSPICTFNVFLLLAFSSSIVWLQSLSTKLKMRRKKPTFCQSYS